MTNQLEMTPSFQPHDLASQSRRVLGWLNAIPDWSIALVARVGIAGLFWRSGQTKVDGWQITDGTRYLFEEEYALPLLPAEIAAYLAVAAEHLFPVLLIIGLASRLSAAALLGMTLVIQIFVYPGSWPDHATWAAVLIFLVARGPGALSFDHLIRKRFASGA